MGGNFMDKFFIQNNCDRCGEDLNNGRIMSMFNTDCICLKCKEKERQDKDYVKASETEAEEVRKGKLNYKGIRK